MLSEIAWKSFGFATILKDIRIFIINNLTLKPFQLKKDLESKKMRPLVLYYLYFKRYKFFKKSL